LQVSAVNEARKLSPVNPCNVGNVNFSGVIANEKIFNYTQQTLSNRDNAYGIMKLSQRNIAMVAWPFNVETKYISYRKCHRVSTDAFGQNNIKPHECLILESSSFFEQRKCSTGSNRRTDTPQDNP
jgi:hypothetical protein